MPAAKDSKGGKPSRGTPADRRLVRNADRKPRKEPEGHRQTDPGQAAARRNRTRSRRGR